MIKNELAEAQSELFELREQLRNSRLKGQALAKSPTRSAGRPNFGVGNFNRSSPSSIGFQVSNKTEENIVSPRRHLNLETRSSQQQQSNRSNRAAINSRDVTQIRDNYFDDKRRYERELLQVKIDARAQIDAEIKRCEEERDNAIAQERAEAALRLSHEVSEAQKSISAKARADLKLDLKRMQNKYNDRHEKEVEKIKSNYLRELKSVKASLTQELADAERRIERLRKSSLQDASDETERVTKLLKARHEEALRANEEMGKQNVERLESTKAREIQELKTTHAKETNKIIMEKSDTIRTYEAKIRELKKLHEAEMQHMEENSRERFVEFESNQNEKLLSIKAAQESKAVTEQQNITQHYEDEISKLKDRHEWSTQQIKEETKRLCVAEIEIKYIEATQTLQNQVARLNRELEQSENKQRNVKENMSRQHQDEVTTLTGYFTQNMNAMVMEHERKLQNLRNAMQKQQFDLSNMNTSKDQGMSQLLLQNTQLKSKVTQMEILIAEMRATNIKNVTDSKKVASAEMNDLQMQHDKLLQSTNHLNNSITNLKNENEKISTEKDTLQKLNQAQTKMIQELENKKSTLEMNNRILNEQNKDKDNVDAVLNKEIQNLKQQNDKLQMVRKELEADQVKLNSLKEDYARIKQENETLLLKGKETNNIVQGKTIALETLKAKYDALHDSNSVLETTFAALNSEKSKILSEKETLEKLNNAQKKMIEELQNEKIAMQLKNSTLIEQKKKKGNVDAIINAEVDSLKEQCEKLQSLNNKLSSVNSEIAGKKQALEKVNNTQNETIQKLENVHISLTSELEKLMEENFELKAANAALIVKNDDGNNDNSNSQLKTNVVSPPPGAALTNEKSQDVFCNYLWKIAQAGPSVGSSVKKLLQEIKDSKSDLFENDSNNNKPLNNLLEKISSNYVLDDEMDNSKSVVTTETITNKKVESLVVGKEEGLHKPTPSSDTIQMTSETFSSNTKDEKAILNINNSITDRKESISVEDLKLEVEQVEERNKMLVNDSLKSMEMQEDARDGTDIAEEKPNAIASSSLQRKVKQRRLSVSVVNSTAHDEDDLCNLLSPLEQEVYDALNLARTNPLRMKAQVKRMMTFLDHDGHLVFEWGKVETIEGHEAYLDCIEFLDKVKITEACHLNNSLLSLAKRLVVVNLDQDTNLLTGHIEHADEEMINEYGHAMTYKDNVEYGPWQTGMDFVIHYIVDDGDASRTNRDHLFAPTTRCCGISVADHELYGSACVMNFAEHFVEGHLLENLNEDSDDQVELGFSVHLRN